MTDAEIAKVILEHETSYIKSSDKPIALYFWKCSCGDEQGGELSWDDCHKKTRQHWASKIIALLAEAVRQARLDEAKWWDKNSNAEDEAQATAQASRLADLERQQEEGRK